MFLCRVSSTFAITKSIQKRQILDCGVLSSKQNSFLRGQFHARHFTSFRSTRHLQNYAGFLVTPSCVLPLTEENVEKVLDEVRPGLMADGGNVALHEIDGLVVVLKLQGACGSCPSSTMTLKWGIETKLRDKIPEILEVEQILDTETGLELNEDNVEKMEDQSSLYTLDEAFSTIRFGKYQMIVLAFAGLGWVAEAMEIMLLSFVGPKVKSQWGLSSNQESMITTVVFAGMLVGAYWWGFVSDTYGRTKSLLGVSLVTSVGGILSAFSSNYVWLVTLRFIVGFGVGGGHVFSSWFLEFVPAPNRGTWMVIFSTFWTVGTIFEAALAWIVMPTLGWRWLLGVSALPSLSFLVFFGLLAESPRYLCMKGRTGEAYQVLKEIALLNRTKLPPGKLVSDQAAISENEKLVPSEDADLLSSTKSYSSTVLVLFSSELIRTTFLLWVVYFGNTFAYYGIVLLTSELSSGQSQCGSHPFVAESNSDSYLYINVFVTSCAELPGLALAAVIVDKVGRKCSMEIMLLLGFVLLLPLILQPNEILTTALLFGARMFISASFIVACIYAPEVYPTSVRSTGVGVATAIGRVGGMLCPLVAVALVSGCHQGTAIVLFEVVLLLVGLCVMLFPFETKGKELSDAVSAPSRTEVTDNIVQ